MTDKSPSIETIFGFVEPYRDPHGVRAEWESVECILDPIESLSFKRLVDESDDFIRLLPWAVPELNAGKGPFEKERFEAPDFASIHGKQQQLSRCLLLILTGLFMHQLLRRAPASSGVVTTYPTTTISERCMAARI